jgi:hypothetical protein
MIEGITSPYACDSHDCRNAGKLFLKLYLENEFRGGRGEGGTVVRNSAHAQLGYFDIHPTKPKIVCVES